MGVVFSFDIKDLFGPPSTPKSPDKNGFYLKGDNGAAVILIHGLTGTPNEMRYLANFLYRKGYSVICPRLANHGEPIRILKNTKWQAFYESVRAALIDVEAAGSGGPIFAAGLSMGALLALLLADEFKDKIRGVCCLAPTLFYDGWNVPNSKYLLPLGYYTPLKHLFYFKEEPPYGIKNKAIQERVHKYYNNAKLDDTENVAQYGYPYFPISLFYQLHLLVKNITKRLPDIRCPVQLIQAKNDDMTSVKNSEFIYDRISSEMKEIVLLHNSYHLVTADHERDIVAQKMEDFFSRVKEGKPELKTRVIRKAEEIPQDEWDKVFPDVPDGYQFYKSMDESGFKQFSFYYILVYDDESLVGIAPCFLMNYPLDTSMRGPLKYFLNLIRKFMPGLFTVKALICGVPMGQGAIGAKGEPSRVIRAISECMEDIAEREKAPIIAFKDFNRTCADNLGPFLKNDFSRIDGLPSAQMEISFASFDEYLSALSRKTRYDLRRKFRKVDGRVKIDTEVADTLKDAALAEVYELYLQMVKRHDMGFEIVPPEFFKNISRNMPGQTKFFLWRIDGKLAAFVFGIVRKDFFSAYYLGLDYSIAYKYSLYFIRFRDIMKWCIENKINHLDVGVTGYEPKKRLGFSFLPLYIYAKHRNKFIRPFFKILCRILKFERYDPVLKEIKKGIS